MFQSTAARNFHTDDGNTFNIVSSDNFCKFFTIVNSIEFWSGDNPLAETETEKSIHGKKGEYLVRYKRNGYRIVNRNTKTSVDLIYDKGTKTWSAMAKNKPVEFMTFLDDNMVRVYLPGGKTMNVELSESGVATFREVIERDYAMLR